jgi:hypothetical protein
LSLVLGHHHTSMRAWSIASLAVCLLPVAIWRVELRGQRAEAAEPVAAEPPAAEPEPEPLPEPIPLRPVPDLPLPDLPAAAAPRKRHQVVRFGRRGERRPLEPMRELAHGRRKDHVVVRFAPPQGSTQPVHDTEPDLAWQMFGEAER